MTSQIPPGTDLSKVPAMQPPPGITPNFVDPPDNRQLLLVLNAVFTSIAVALVLLRLSVKGFVSKVLWWDDLSCVLAALASITHAVVMMYMCNVGYGRHMWDIPVSWLITKPNMRMLSANNIVYLTSIWLAKMSMLLLYLRIFPRHTNMGRWIISMAVFLTVFWIAMMGPAIAAQFKCVQVTAQTTAFCKAMSKDLVIVQSSITVATDYYILLLPIPPFFKLLFQTRQKILIITIFMTGLVACAASTVRLALFVDNLNHSDTLWDAARLSVYTIVEINAAIMSGCLLNVPAAFGHSKGLMLRAYRSVSSLVSSRASSTRNSSSSRSSSGMEEVRVGEAKDPYSTTIEPERYGTRFREGDV